jgi:hypothetical protein
VLVWKYWSLQASSLAVGWTSIHLYTYIYVYIYIYIYIGRERGRKCETTSTNCKHFRSIDTDMAKCGSQMGPQYKPIYDCMCIYIYTHIYIHRPIYIYTELHQGRLTSGTNRHQHCLNDRFACLSAFRDRARSPYDGLRRVRRSLGPPRQTALFPESYGTLVRQSVHRYQ